MPHVHATPSLRHILKTAAATVLIASFVRGCEEMFPPGKLAGKDVKTENTKGPAFTKKFQPK